MRARKGGGDAVMVTVRHYAATLSRHGATTSGVDWESRAAQDLRFVQLLKLCDFTRAFSLNDVGCGYGALIAHLDQFHPGCRVTYSGTDLCAPMIAEARAIWAGRPATTFVNRKGCAAMADYTLASGIFNVMADCAAETWHTHIADCLSDMGAHSRLGFAVNFIAHHAPDVPGLYRAPDGMWQAHCAAIKEATVETVIGYGLREFTLLVRFSA